MGQRFKNVYFADYPSDSSGKKNLTLAFGEKDSELYSSLRGLSSHELRELLGHHSYTELQRSAASEYLTLNAYCLRQLKSNTTALSPNPLQMSLMELPEVADFNVDPIHTTFRGGQAEPLHGWFQFLEGYSPAFVEQVVRSYAPDAHRILDPFAGSGTTPLTLARLGRGAYYCEVNPLMQYLIHAKTRALRLNYAERHHTALELRRLAETVDQWIADKPDPELDKSYRATFGASEFFDPSVYRQVLSLRAALDQVACGDETTGLFATVAALGCLLPASRLIRRGDIRYKTERERQRHQTHLLPALQEQLRRIADDLTHLLPTDESPVFVCASAQHLHLLPYLDLDAVVTSPPYLNGTNYFRNTKIELWFLRCLRRADDLTGFRSQAITAGINDVTVGKSSGGSTHPRVAALVSALRANAYDPRIPRMIESYFREMVDVFSAVHSHLRDESVVAVDIGDSMYGGTHVPTDSLLADALEPVGFRLADSITLRRRMSRAGTALKQSLLVFKRGEPTAIRAAAAVPAKPARWEATWSAFKVNLPHQGGEFAKRNWGHPLHSLCSYQGKMKPALAHHLVRTFAPPGGRMLDPFAGVGTIPFEAALAGVKTWGFDISPAALHIAEAKVGRVDANQCRGLLQTLEEFIAANEVREMEIEAASAIRFNGPLTDYYEERTFQEILLARRYFMAHPPANPSDSLVFASLLHVLHGNRPYALSRNSHPITPFSPTGPAEYKSLIKHTADKVERSLAAELPASFEPGEILAQDATEWWPQRIDQLDAVITSPPFFDSTRFYLANWLRLWFCGWEASDFRVRPRRFVDERQKASFDVYLPVLRQARERLRAGGVVVLHLGKSAKCDMAAQIARLSRYWFKTADVFDESVTHCESHGIRDKGTVTSHQYLVLS